MMELINNENQEDVPLRFPVKLKHAGSLHRMFLRDVEGRVIRDDNGRQLNLYSDNIVDYIACGRIRFIYDVSKEYRYIITSEHQYRIFQSERTLGSIDPHCCYHVYYDSDATPVQFYRYGWKQRSKQSNRHGTTKTIPL